MFRDILAVILLVMLFSAVYKTNGKMDLYIIDKDTGCQYMVSWYGMPGNVRLDEEGKPMGCSNLENWQKREVKAK